MTVLNYQITASIDDGTYNVGGIYDYTWYVQIISGGMSNPTRSMPCLIFRGIDVPKDAAISSAKIILRCNDILLMSPVSVPRWYGWDTDNATNFDDGANRPDQVPRTTASAELDVYSLSAGTSSEYDVTEIIQEIVNRPGWTAGNDMGLFSTAPDNSSMFSFFADFNSFDHPGSPSAIPQLVIEFEASPPIEIDPDPVEYALEFSTATVGIDDPNTRINPDPVSYETVFSAPSIFASALINPPSIQYSLSFSAPDIAIIDERFETRAGREPITIIEIDQDFCGLTYGESPCTAQLGVTGFRKCFNTLPTCQARSAFLREALTLRFCTATSDYPRKTYAIPTVQSVSTNPTEINVGTGDQNMLPLGRRASVTIEFRDIPYNDRLVDKYRDERAYKPEEQGTFWSKWLARNLYYQNRPLRVREGYVGQSLSRMRTRHYFIDKIEGPDSNGRVRVTAKDVLKFADNKRAQCPKPSNGRLAGDITKESTSFTLLPEDIGDEYPESGIGRIGDELMSFTRAGDVVTITERGLRGTEIEEHDEDDSFQLVKVFDATRVDLIIKELLEDYADVPGEFIPAADWAAEASRWLSGYSLSTWITEPTGVSDLLGEILQQCICYIWWDEYDQKIRFKPIRPLDPVIDNLRIIDEKANIVAESVTVQRDPDQRVSQIWFYYRQNNPVENLENHANYGRLSIRADLPAEAPEQYGESRINKVFSRWFTQANEGQVITTGTILLLRYRDNPLIVTFSLDAKDRGLRTGDVARVTHRSIVDETGQPIPTLLQVIKTVESQSGHRIDYKCQVFGFVGRFGFIMPNDAPDYEEASDEERRNGMWISENEEPFFPDGEDAYRII